MVLSVEMIFSGSWSRISITEYVSYPFNDPAAIIRVREIIEFLYIGQVFVNGDRLF